MGHIEATGKRVCNLLIYTHENRLEYNAFRVWVKA